MTNIIREHLIHEATSDINLLLRDLLKVIKVLSLYPPDNPLPIKMRTSVGRRFIELVVRFDGLKFDIQPDKLIYRKEAVFKDSGKEEALASLFHDAGIIILEFMNGLPPEEFNSFLDRIKDYINDRSSDRDLVSLLWQEQFDHIAFKTVEDIAIGKYDSELVIDGLYSEYNSGGDKAGKAEYGDIFLDIREEQAREAAASPEDLLLEPRPDQDKGLELFTNGSYSLTSEENREIRRLLEENRYFNPYRSAARILVEILHLWDEKKPFFDTVGACEKMLDELLTAGAFTVAADFVHSIRGRQESLVSIKPVLAARLEGFLRRAGDKKRIEQLTDIVNLQETADTGALEIYLESLDWESLAHITDMLGKLVAKNARLMVCDYLARHSRERITVIGNGIQDKRWYIVRNSVMILGRIGGEHILTYLEQTVDHPDSRVRAETIRALAGIKSDAAVYLLCRFLEDGDSELRLSCLKYLEQAGGHRAFESLRSIINSEEFEKYSMEEQEWFLIALSRLGGEEVVDYLTSIIGTVRFFAPAHSIRYRLAALTALVHNRSDNAEKAILKFTCSRRRWLREAASAAMEQRRKLIYGGGLDDDAE
jgi:hypothetical protein